MIIIDLISKNKKTWMTYINTSIFRNTPQTEYILHFFIQWTFDLAHSQLSHIDEVMTYWDPLILMRSLLIKIHTYWWGHYLLRYTHIDEVITYWETYPPWWGHDLLRYTHILMRSLLIEKHTHLDEVMTYWDIHIYWWGHYLLRHTHIDEVITYWDIHIYWWGKYLLRHTLIDLVITYRV